VLTKRVTDAETAAADAEKRAETAEEMQIAANAFATSQVEKLNEELASDRMQRSKADADHAAALARFVLCCRHLCHLRHHCTNPINALVLSQKDTAM
jgi:hypothetical protein